MPSMPSLEQLQRGLEAAGQAHVLRFWPELGAEERAAFLRELGGLDLRGLREHCEGAARAAAAAAGEGSPGAGLDRSPDRDMEPIPPELVGGGEGSGDERSRWEEEGLLQISQGRVGVLLLAGGQGTRLGVSYPKGMYDVGLPSGKSLYQIQAERLRRVQQLAEERTGSRCRVPWYIMTSDFTLAATESFFQQNRYFGLEPANVVMFEQRMLPAVSLQGKLLLQGKGKVAMAPDGNGGLYQALADHQVLEDMKEKGVEFLQVYCVDNILVKMADPVFLGFCVSRGADCGAKVVRKRHPGEPVGVVCRVRGVPRVLEYSELRPETARLRGPEGQLLYGAGNICIHFFTRGFLQELAQKFLGRLDQHVALKKVPFLDDDGNLVTPGEPNGIKMEKFVFDVFPFSSNFVLFEAVREEEFSPLKNADGAAADTPTTARDSLLALHRRWLFAAGAALLDGPGDGPGDGEPPGTGEPPGNPPGTGEPPAAPSHSASSGGHAPAPGGHAPAPVEISPLVSYFGEGLEQLVGGRTLATPLILDEKKAEELRAT
ncbi:UDP-N-acetylhexosamine pyrophosphorylase-like protein 1 [Cololabis saira]|uniref:UDP-N-acetylhexosamine pyrophosphorylase-like protein 1 n=1 Tax=Cololabis saira TaxID=129043 RepID=UPI002AD285F7|nr:UDP-N-acetylhexosamine pyrophosphorylase-like protein 1 [Cololabis saira]